MSILKKLSAIFTKDSDSETGYLIGSVEDSIDKVKEALSDMEIQSAIESSTGEWLDEWGKRFGEIRYSDEADETYRMRILSTVTNRKGSIPALKDAVRRALGEDTRVEVEETYNDLRIFNVSTFSGTGKFQDSDTIRLGVVRLFIDKPINDLLRQEIWRSKAAGIRVIILPIEEYQG